MTARIPAGLTASAKASAVRRSFTRRWTARLYRTADPRRALAFINAAVVHSDGTIGSTVRVARGRIAGLDVAPSREDLVVDCGGAVILPGLINAHDHLELNSFGRLKWRERYDNVAEWFDDFRPRSATHPALVTNRADTLADRLLVGALKNLLGGATTVCHHNPIYPPLRNGCPVRVVRRFGWSHSLHIEGDRVRASYRRTPGARPWIVHAAEGTDARAASELSALDRLGCLGPNTVLVHGVGLSAADRRLALARGCALVWCPSSNQFLLGRTADVGEFSAAGRLAIGSDSRLSGDGDLLDELRAARATGLISARDIIRAVTCDAAYALRLPRAGELVEGAPADLAIFPDRRSDPFNTVIDARRADLRLVMIDGRPVVADPDLAHVFAAHRVGAVAVCLDGRPKILAASIADRARRAAIGEPGLEVLA